MVQMELKNIEKSYEKKTVFKDFNLTIEKGEFIGIKGESGKGKTTLLNIIGLMENCQGSIFIEGEQVSSRDRKKVKQLLKNKIGYLFQNFALIDDFTVYDNLKIVMEKKTKEEMRNQMIQALLKVGLKGEYLDKKVYKLSGGEQQRVAVARLILKKSDIILADEPTGSLDRKNSETIMKLLEEFHKEDKTIIMVTHDEKMLEYCTRVVEL